MYKYKFTIFTPCYNSAKTIHRVFESLMSQTIDHDKFEWLVINDASTDNTNEIIEKYIEEADFDIKYINLEKNQMIIKNYFLAIKNAKGEWFLPTGHDDRFESNTLEIFSNIINEIKYKYTDKNFFSIACLCKDQYGVNIGDDFPTCYEPVKILDIGMKWNREKIGESWGIQKTNYMEKFFILDERIVDELIYIPESFFWNKIALEASEENLYVYPINNRLRIYYKENNFNNLSSNIRMKYPLGFEYESQVMINDYGSIIKTISKKLYVKYLVKYILFNIYNGRTFLNSINNLKNIRDKIYYVFLYPFVFIMKNNFFKG